MTLAHEEIIDFILAGKTPEQVAAFQASDAVKARVGDLIWREKNESLSSAETAELESYMQLEHLMRLAKARARKLPNSAASCELAPAASASTASSTRTTRTSVTP